jgi:hypothetical protein
VYGRSPNGKVDKTPKGSLEVVKVIGPHLSQTRVGALRDFAGDPIQEGDQVFNPAWNPNRKTHVAIAGIVDFTGEGSGSLADQVRNLREFINNLERQNIVVDAYLDLRTNTVKIPDKGEGMTLKTDFFILAEGPRYDSEPILNFKDEKINTKQMTNEMMEKMRKDAIKKGVTVIPLRKFEVLTGYRVPRSYQSGSVGSVETDTTAGPPEAKDKREGEDKPKKEEKKDEKKLGEEKGQMDEKKKKEDEDK